MTATAQAAAPKKKRTLMDILRALRQRKMAVMLALGFSSGLPFMLFGNTLTFWLAEGGVKRATIGFLSWAGTVFLIKFVWGAIVDRLPAPFLMRMGRRRGWLIITQVMVAIGLVGIALSGPQRVPLLALFAVLCALGSAMQDTVVDAWRIEVADHPDELGLLTSVYSFGYRAALVFSEAIILILAQSIGWPPTYLIYAGLMVFGLTATLFAQEPLRTIERPTIADRGLSKTLVAAWDAVVEPFVTFFRAHGVAIASLTLLVITTYHLCDYMRGPMSGPYYTALGIPKDFIGYVRSALLPVTLLGTAAGGVASIRFGLIPTLVIGAILQPIAIAAFAILANHGGDFAVLSYGGAELTAFELIMAADAFSIAFSGVALIAYMSSLTTIGYTATQYALLTSAMAWSGKLLKGFSGTIVDGLQAQGRSDLEAYGVFYLGCGLIGIPAILLTILAVMQHRRRMALAAASSPAT
jgi:MFS transporter, PAT family, beta-lactamase induction signal transducer AmpG